MISIRMEVYLFHLPFTNPMELALLTLMGRLNFWRMDSFKSLVLSGQFHTIRFITYPSQNTIWNWIQKNMNYHGSFRITRTFKYMIRHLNCMNGYGGML